jgi:hypothetical protein
VQKELQSAKSKGWKGRLLTIANWRFQNLWWWALGDKPFESLPVKRYGTTVNKSAGC